MDPNQPTEVNPVSFGNSLPPELQQQLLELQRRKQLALTMQQQAMQPVQAQSHGPIASRVSPLAPLLQGVTGYLAGKNAAAADKGIAGLQGQYQSDTSAEIGRLLALPDQNDMINQGLQSRNPIVQALANQQRTQREARAKEAIHAVGEYDPNVALTIARTGQIPQGGIAPPAEPVYGSTSIPNPGGAGLPPIAIPTVTNTGKGGIKTGQVVAPGPVINVATNIPTKEGELALGGQQDELKTRQSDAKVAMATIQQNRLAVEALQQGAQAGGGQDIKQTLRKVGQAFGLDLPATAQTDELQMALGKAILTHAADLRPMSDADLKFLQKQAGSINSDPTALAKMLAITSGAAIKQLQDYRSFVSTAQTNSKNPHSSALYQNGLTGYDMPKTLSGPFHHQMEVVQELHRRGGDISQFSYKGQPFDENSSFDLSPSPITGGGSGVKPVSAMSEAEKAAEIKALKAQLGIK